MLEPSLLNHIRNTLVRSLQIQLSSIAILVACATSAAGQSSIAARVAQAPDGIVRVQFAARPGACGNGRDVIGFRKAFFAKSFQSYGSWSADGCVAGPVRVALRVANGRAVGLETFVAGQWTSATGKVTDLGTVSPAEAAAYFFALVPELESRSNKDRVLLPAVLADDPNAVARLTALAKNASRSDEVRRQSLHWIGLLGDASAVPTLVAFARQGSTAGSARDDNDESLGPENNLGGAAMAALTFVEGGAGIPALIDLSAAGSSRQRGSALFWLGQTGDARARAALHRVIDNAGESDALRSRAVFALTHGDEIPDAEFAYLRTLYHRVKSERLRNTIVQGMAEDRSGGSTWLLQIAGDASEPVHSRKTALFWAGQRESTPTTDLVAFYARTTEPQLREHAIFVLSQRDDAAAVDELLRIAREDKDRQMRSKALFWLGQKDDPRVAKLISDRLSR